MTGSITIRDRDRSIDADKERERDKAKEEKKVINHSISTGFFRSDAEQYEKQT